MMEPEPEPPSWGTGSMNQLTAITSAVMLTTGFVEALVDIYIGRFLGGILRREVDVGESRALYGLRGRGQPREGPRHCPRALRLPYR